MSSRTFTPEEEQIIHKLRKRGYSYGHIGDKLNVRRRAIQFYCKYHKIKREGLPTWYQ